ncbi:hypothetical protein PBV87_08125 [Niameybacter massiliensis]|uniref:Bacterial repeat domain-containing protein n=1 Tax=Holtiella tumoricola TaxID=3018743 RepID=A0AA42DMA4_9FIRM|nr:hypothetical protein [Holtiella tumoricola]MDA3731442.1 hypothetical protein [Holtiella tumoricola]
MNSRLDLFNNQLEKNGVDATVNNCHTRVLVKDIDNKGLIQTKHIHIPLHITLSIGDTITIGYSKYMVLNINTNDCFNEVVVQEMYHLIKVQYSWLSLMQLDVIIQGISQTVVDSNLISYDDTSVYVLIKKDDTTSQIKKGTRFFLFDIPYKIQTVTWENSRIMKCRCNIDLISPSDDVANQIADNSHMIPPTIKYVINASAGANGVITPNGDIEVEKGKVQTFTITPNSGYEVDTILVDGENILLNENRYTFENVQDNHTISATFKEVPIPTGTIEGESKMYLGWEESYTLTGVVNPTTAWSVDNSYVKIISSTNTTCTLICESSSQANKTFTLSADVKGVVVTKSIQLVL